MATLAFFFALTGAATAGVKYVTASDPIPAGSDLTGTYGSPTIGEAKVTSAKIADGAITSSKLDPTVTAPNAARLGGLDASDFVTGPGRVVTVAAYGDYVYPYFVPPTTKTLTIDGLGTITLTCDPVLEHGDIRI